MTNPDPLQEIAADVKARKEQARSRQNRANSNSKRALFQRDNMRMAGLLLAEQEKSKALGAEVTRLEAELARANMREQEADRVGRWANDERDMWRSVAIAQAAVIAKGAL